MNNRSSSPQPTFVGIDVGGTKVRALASDLHGQVLGELREPTGSNVVDQIARIARQLGGPSLFALGVGVPGAVDPASGAISRIPNVPELNGVHLSRRLTTLLGVPVAVENDLAAAALAEDAAFPSTGTVAVIAAGTGIGLGIVHGGSLIRGATGAAGEIADIPLESGGTLEDVVSIAGIRESYEAMSKKAVDDVDAILTLAEDGDPLALECLAGYSRGLAHVVRIVFAVLDPELLILTGGLTGSGTVAESLTGVIREFAPRVRFSSYGVDAPAQGAVALARQIAPTIHGFADSPA